MSDFILHGEDYIDFIKNEEDLALFNRSKYLYETELHKPIRECIEAVKEAANIERKLKGLPPVVFIDARRPNLN